MADLSLTTAVLIVGEIHSADIRSGGDRSQQRQSPDLINPSVLIPSEIGTRGSSQGKSIKDM